MYIPKISQKDNRIMVFKQKNGYRYFQARTAKEVYDACLKILNEKYEFVIYEPKEPKMHPVPDTPYGLSGELLDKYNELLSENTKNLVSYNSMKSMHDIYLKAINEAHGQLAWFIISECFYDYYDFEILENV